MDKKVCKANFSQPVVNTETVGFGRKMRSSFLTHKKILFAGLLLILAASGCSQKKVVYELPLEPQARSISREIYTPPKETLTNENYIEPQKTVRHKAHNPPKKIARNKAYNLPQEVAINAYKQPEPAKLATTLATYETTYNPEQKNRSHNITRAAASINGAIVNPGETFSYNETVGPTGKRRGYKKDIIYVKGEKKKGYGGGVCQVSTTLFNAAEQAEMTILERHDHSRPVAYAKPGKEAATSYGGIDFKFKNEKPYPIIIDSVASNGTIKIKINSM